MCVGVGYQGRSLEDLCQLIDDMDVEVVVDVRQRAWSYRPEMRKDALAAELDRRAIQYIHLGAAGNPFRPRSGKPANFEQCAEQYRRFIERDVPLLARLRSLMGKHRTALLCYEEDGHLCHRSVLVQAMDRNVGRVEMTDL